MTGPSETYKAFALYYDAYISKFTGDLDFYLSLCNKDDKILEVGCGTGRVLKKFLEHDFLITGIDISPEMLEIAASKLSFYLNEKKLTLSILDLSTKRMKESYDTVLITFYTFNYILKKPEAFLHNLYNSVSDKGKVVFDLFYPKSFSDESISGKWFETIINAENRTILLKDKREIKSNIEIRNQIYIEEGNKIKIDTERRYFPPDEMKNLLLQAGFKNVFFSLKYHKDHFRESIDEKALVTNYLIIAEK
jgi:SAM-dependent methyltransferase